MGSRLPKSVSMRGAPNVPRDKRESNAERRAVTRTGRRQTDPVPRCPSCGLPVVTGPHASDSACKLALQEARRQMEAEIELLRNASLTFGELADRLNRQLQTLRAQLRTSDGTESKR